MFRAFYGHRLIAGRRCTFLRPSSILSFAGFNTLQAIGALHGYFQHDMALMVGMLASLMTCGTVTGLAAYFSRRGPAAEAGAH